jgi:malonyl-CoA O-methyltransferase
MNPKKEFTRFAKNYQYLSTIQQEIAKELISNISKTKKNILDIGCGNGNIYNQIKWQLNSFYGIDISQKMCKLHPQKENIYIKEANFDNIEIYNFYKNKNIDLITSSSSLQWSKNIENIFQILPSISHNISLSIFTNNSLKDLLDELSLPSFLIEKDNIINLIQKTYNIKTYTKIYTQYFKTTRDLLVFIKQSGISGGMQRTKVSNIKRIILDNKIKKASFEVLFITSH